jgi:hypothetical protein
MLFCDGHTATQERTVLVPIAMTCLLDDLRSPPAVLAPRCAARQAATERASSARPARTSKSGTRSTPSPAEDWLARCGADERPDRLGHAL